jgi:hypothetical protein
MGGQLAQFAKHKSNLELQNYARYCQAVANTTQIGVESAPGLIEEAISEWLKLSATTEKGKADSRRERRKLVREKNKKDRERREEEINLIPKIETVEGLSPLSYFIFSRSILSCQYFLSIFSLNIFSQYFLSIFSLILAQYFLSIFSLIFSQYFRSQYFLLIPFFSGTIHAQYLSTIHLHCATSHARY